jgi:hypothetical protein
MDSSAVDGQARMQRLFERSAEFEDALASCFPQDDIDRCYEDPRYEHCWTACMASLQHAHALRVAFMVGSPISGAALLRLQYEALLRGAWLCHAATPAQVEKLSQSLNLEAEKAAKNLPSLQDMLAAVEKKAPPGLAAPLIEFNVHHRHALNSFVHSGIHALHRTSGGFPLELALRLVAISNGLTHMAYRMLASLLSSQELVDKVSHAYRDFQDCLALSPQEEGA